MLETIIKYIQTQLTTDACSVGPDTNLTQEGHLDSTGMLELVLWVGDTYNFAIQSEDLTPENFATPRHILEFVQRRQSEDLSAVPQDSPRSEEHTSELQSHSFISY